MTEQVRLAMREEAGLPAVIPPIPAEYADEGMEEIERDDIALPRVRVLQPTSQLEGPRGEFHFSLTGKCKKTIPGVLLRVAKGRVYWEKGNLSGAPLCASDDSKMPRTQYVGGYADRCADCELKEWHQDGTPPECGLTYSFLGVDIEEKDTPFLLTMRGTSVKHARNAFSAPKLQGAPLYATPVTISSVHRTTEKGSFYEVVIVPREVANFDWRPYREMYLLLKTETITADTEQTNGVAEEDEKIPF